MKKGFTLVELLAVIVILGVVLVLAIPNIKNAIETSYEKTYEFNLENLKSAAKDYFTDKGLRINSTEKRVINITQMVEENYIKVIKDPNTNDVCEGYVAITKNYKNYIYEPYLKCGDNYISNNYDEIVVYLPVITVLGSNPVNININNSYIDAGATAKDYIGTDITSSIVVTSNVDTSIPGSYTVTYTATDSTGNQNTAKRVVNVIDNIAPTITFNPNSNSTYARSRDTVVKVNDSGGLNENSLKYVWTTSTTQPSSSAFTSIYKNNQPVTTPSNVCGIYYLWVTASDKTGNTTVKSSGAFYIDNVNPIITMAGSNPVTVSRGSTYSDAGATAKDSFGTSLTVTSSGTVNPNIIGTYTITYTATDSYGNKGMATRTINVIDTTAPVITLNGSNPTNINVNSTYTDSGATALDDVDGNITSKITATGTVNPSVVGTYTVTYTVKDSSNNTATKTRTINVIDNIAPTVAFGTNGNSTYAKSRSTTVTVSDAHTGVNGSSLKCQWTTSTTAPTEASFSTAFTSGGTISSPAGVTGGYYLWILAKDNAGNTTIIKTNVFNLDNTKPIITMNGSSTVTVNKGSTYKDAGATATDAHSGISGSVTATGTVNPSIIGTYTITYNVNDNAGNAATPVVRTINVVDVLAPVITMLGSNPVNINVNGTYADAGATAVDDVDGDVTSKITTTGTVNPSVAGTYTITYTVKDNANNTAISTRTVNVLDNILPTVAFGTNGNATYAKTRSTTVTVSDNVSVNTSSLKYLWNTSTTAPSEASFSTTFTNGGTISSPAGVTGLYYLWILAKDNAGNTLIARTNVFYLDNTASTIATAIAGTMLYADPTFASGINGISGYNNTGDGTVTVTRTTISGAPLGSGYGLTIQTTAGTSTPGFGGFYFGNTSAANKTYITRIVAKIPVGYSINWATNAIGTGSSYAWLTSTAGTGDWQEYIYQANTGSTGTFSSTNYFYLTGSPTPTSASPLTWYVAYATVFDTTKLGTSNSVIFTSSDVASGIVGYGMNQSSTTAPTFTSVTNTSSLNTGIDNITVNGTYYVWVKDAAGNTSNKSFVVNYADAVAPTVSVALSNHQLSTFTNWSLSGAAYIDGSGQLVLPTTGNSSATSPYIPASGTYWSFGMNGLVTNPSPNCTPNGCIYIGSAYYDTNYAAAVSDNTYTGNGYAPSLALNTVTPISWDGWSGDGPNVYYVRISASADGGYGVAPITLSNFKFYCNGGYSNYAKVVTVTASDTNGIKLTKWLSGTKTIADFTSAGTTFTNSFEVTSNATYTIYAEDNAGNKTVYQQAINDIDIAGPTAPTSVGMTFSDAVTNYANNTWTNKSVYIYGGISGSTDSMSGVAKYQLSSDNSTWYDYSYDSANALYGLTSQGTQYRYARAVDRFGNAGSVTTKTIKIDKTAPVITRNGSSAVTIGIGSTYADAGATATDSLSGVNGSVTSSSNVNTSVAGTYTVTYNVSDNAGNAATPVTRTVNVVSNKVAAKIPAGSYSVGQAVTYAGINWHVIRDNGSSVTLLANWGTIASRMRFDTTYNATYKTCTYSPTGYCGNNVWATSEIKAYLNGTWLTNSQLSTGFMIDDGNGYVRLISSNEYSTLYSTVGNQSWLYSSTISWWLTMTASSEYKVFAVTDAGALNPLMEAFDQAYVRPVVTLQE
jgi:prepilin-type N-terminal cleavage/methylation domain-containing protein